MGPLHAYGIATRIQQVSEDLLNLNQGTLYPALVRLEQQGWIKGSWGKSENNREAKFYAITRTGEKALGKEHKDTANAMSDVAAVLHMKGDRARAEATGSGAAGPSD